MVETATEMAQGASHAVVIIDDDVGFVQDFGAIIENQRHMPYIAAHSSLVAIKRIHDLLEETETEPRVIFLDLHMEDDFSGYRVLKYIRKERNNEHLPVVMLSHSGDPHDVAQAYEMGATSYIQKPMDVLKMRAMLAKVSEYWCDLNRQTLSGEDRGSKRARVSVVKSPAGDFEMARLPNMPSFRKAAGLSINKLANLSGVNLSHVSAADRGDPIRIGDLYKIIRAIALRMKSPVDLEAEIVRTF